MLPTAAEFSSTTGNGLSAPPPASRCEIAASLLTAIALLAALAALAALCGAGTREHVLAAQICIEQDKDCVMKRFTISAGRLIL
jgi:hypothetical protein